MGHVGGKKRRAFVIAAISGSLLFLATCERLVCGHILKGVPQLLS